jgi:hypothetical protein
MDTEPVLNNEQYLYVMSLDESKFRSNRNFMNALDLQAFVDLNEDRVLARDHSSR